MDGDARPAAGTRINRALRIDAEKFRAGACRNLDVGNEGLDPAGLEVPDANAPLPARIPVRVGHAVGNVDVPFVVDGDRAWLAELGPAGDEVPFLVEHLDPLIAAVGDVETSFAIDRDVVRIVEPQRIGALGPEAAAPRLHELPIFREPHQPVVAAARPIHVLAVRAGLVAAVAVSDPDIAVLRDHHTGRPVEVRLVRAGHAGLPEAHEDLAIGAELPDLVAH